MEHGDPYHSTEQYLGDILNMVSVSQNLTQTENPGHNPEHYGPQEPV